MVTDDKFMNKQRILGEWGLKTLKAAEAACVYVAKWMRC